jgi:hypothetical protein
MTGSAARQKRRRLSPRNVQLYVNGVAYPAEAVDMPDFELEGWHALVRDWQGNLVYDGPTPVPDELVTLTAADALAGRVFHFEMTPP